MALVKPIVNDIVAFDANVGTTITFTASGGDQVTKNEVKIVKDVVIGGLCKEVTVYEDVVTSYSLSHIIPPNASSGSYTLTNGDYCRLAIRTYDVLDNTSEWSNYQPFYCYTTPTIEFNIFDGQTLKTSNYNINLTYRQIENEKVDYAIIKLYNATNL